MAKRSKAPSDGLNPRQRLFALEYAISLNATDAYRKVYGATQQVAETNGPRLLGNARVQAFLESRLRKQEKRLELRTERLDELLAELTEFDPAELVDEAGNVKPLRSLPTAVRRALRGVKVRETWAKGTDTEPARQDGRVVEVRFGAREEAIGLAYRRLGALRDRLEVDVRGHAELLAEAYRRMQERKEQGQRNGVRA